MNTNSKRVVHKDAGWRQAMPDMRERAEALIADLDRRSEHRDADVIRRLLHLLDSREANSRAEERAAWDTYAAANGAKHADQLLEERRKRFQ